MPHYTRNVGNHYFMAFLNINFFSETLGMGTTIDVVLPLNTLDSQDKHPVLYLLHGLSDNYSIFSRRTSIERYAEERGLCVVMPSGDTSWYTDMQYGYKFYSFITEELPAVCRAFFPNVSTERKDSFIAGISMGGYGAFKMAIRNPEKYAAAGSLSGAVDIVRNTNIIHRNPDCYWSDIFGPLDKLEGSENDLFAVIRAAADSPLKPKLFSWCGEGDGFINDNRKMKECLINNGFDLNYNESEGDHQWKYWDEHIQDFIDWLPLNG